MAKVLVPLANGCEELKAVRDHRSAARRHRGGDSGLQAGVVPASRGAVASWSADVTLDVALQDDYDMVVLPGGMPGATL